MDNRRPLASHAFHIVGKDIGCCSESFRAILLHKDGRGMAARGERKCVGCEFERDRCVYGRRFAANLFGPHEPATGCSQQRHRKHHCHASVQRYGRGLVLAETPQKK
jgi:hypothetical protein